MTAEEMFFVWLHYEGLTRKKLWWVMENYQPYTSFGKALQQNDSTAITYLGEELARKIQTDLSNENILKHANMLAKHNISVLLASHKAYPQELLCLEEDAPPILYYKGNVNVLSSRKIAVVGTRKPTQYAREMTAKFSAGLAEKGFTVVSGLAYGIDTEAAVAALGLHKPTIAVLANGLDTVYPEQNTMLARKIEENGLLLSENPMHTQPQPYQFLERNRIISALSEGVLIVEAGEKSGALNTAQHAINQGKELFVLPSLLTNKQGRGSNRLLTEVPDAFTTSVEDICARLHIEVVSTSEQMPMLTENEQKVYAILEEGETEFDVLQERTNMDTCELNSLLTSMEIRGIIRKLPANFYSL